MSDNELEHPKVIDKDVVPVTKADVEQRKAAKKYLAGNPDELTMEVKVWGPFNNYFNGPALSVSGVNLTGPFDILPKHHNFMSLLEPCTLIVRTKTQESRIEIDGGLMHVKADKVTVFLDI